MDFPIVHAKTFPKIPNVSKLVNNSNCHFWFQIYKGIVENYIGKSDILNLFLVLFYLELVSIVILNG